MTLETITKEIDNIKFNINQLPALKCLKLEKQTIKFLLPVFHSLDGLKDIFLKIKKEKEKENFLDTILNSEINFSSIVNSIQSVLTNLDDETYETYIMSMIDSTTARISDSNGKEKIIVLRNIDEFNLLFRGKNITVYKLLIEIMRVNKFCFFAFAGGIDTIINMLPAMKINETK